MKEAVKELAVLSDAQNEVWFSVRMEEGPDGPVFKMYYALTKGDRVKVETDFMPSDHTWVGAKIGLFANIAATESKNGYADFEYIHVEAL